mgnify:CR=1 FL=1
MTTKDMDLDCYWINLETADNEAFKRMITDELESKIDTLQTYNFDKNWMEYVWKQWLWEYVKYSDLVELLNR